jgi:hypothetical protein
MRKIFSERNIVVFLFLVAMTVFSLAQEDAKRVEKMYIGTGAEASTSIIPAPQKTALLPYGNNAARVSDQK